MVKKSYNEKLQHNGDLPKVESIAGSKQGERLKAETMLIAAPQQYDALMKRVPPGRLTTIDRLMSCLAKEHKADTACPMTAGIFVNIAAHASEERLGVDETPYWRTLKKGGELNEKYPGGLTGQQQRLEAEGHTVAQRGKRLFVQDHEAKVFDF
ncbi:MAG: MGMT family protein [Clostridiales bacterium]|nr:MGMT family protein [Clostridiales bacterium]